MKTIFTFFNCCLIAVASFSQSGTLDRSFGDTGVVVTPINGVLYALGLQSDNKIIAAGVDRDNGTEQFVLMRYLTDGKIDATFGENGVSLVNNNGEIYSIKILPNDEILAVGSQGGGNSQMQLAKYLPDGKLDSSFGINGQVNPVIKGFSGIQLNAVQIQEDKEIVATGISSQYDPLSGYNNQIFTVRFNADGSFDESFGGTGYVFLKGKIANALVIQPDGKIVIGGSTGLHEKFITARYLPDGSLDESYGPGGIVTTGFSDYRNYINALALQPDGKIIATGPNADGNEGMLTVRYLPDGSIDKSFGDKGIVLTKVGTTGQGISKSIALQDDGKIIIAGYGGIFYSDVYYATVRLDTNGLPDPSFGDKGLATTKVIGNDYAYSCILQNDGKILVGGINDDVNFIIARYNNDVVLAEPLQHFAATAIPNGGVALSWQAANENGVSAYKVQRSANVQFNNVTQLAQVAIGSSHYTYTDNTPLQGTNYYRIAQVSHDGANSYSGIVSASIGGSVSMSLFPNPIKDVVNIKGLDVIMNYKLLINNAKGDRVATTTISHISGYAWNVQPLASGVYYIRLTSNQNKTVTLRFVKE